MTTVYWNKTADWHFSSASSFSNIFLPIFSLILILSLYSRCPSIACVIPHQQTVLSIAIDIELRYPDDSRHPPWETRIRRCSSSGSATRYPELIWPSQGVPIKRWLLTKSPFVSIWEISIPLGWPWLRSPYLLCCPSYQITDNAYNLYI